MVANAAIQPLDSFARNPLICNGCGRGLCGLRAYFGERGRSEEWPGESGMSPGTGNSGGWRSPQAFAGTRASTRELARSGKQKPQPRTVGVSILVVGRYPVPNRVESTQCKPCGLARTPAETSESPLQGADVQAVWLPDWLLMSADQLCRGYGQFNSHLRNRTRVRAGCGAAKRPLYRRIMCGE